MAQALRAGIHSSTFHALRDSGTLEAVSRFVQPFVQLALRRMPPLPSLPRYPMTMAIHGPEYAWVVQLFSTRLPTFRQRSSNAL